MGNKSSLMLQDEEIQQIREETGFSSTQIEKLFSRFAHLDRNNTGTLSRNDLLSIPELAINPLCDRLVRLFFVDCDQEDGRINFREFMRILATFRSSSVKSNREKSGGPEEENDSNIHSEIPITTINSSNKSIQVKQSYRSDQKLVKTLSELEEGLRDKLLFVFKIYDLDNDGRVSFNDLRGILKMMVGNYIEEAQLDKIASRAFVEADEDGDGYIEFREFCKVFEADELNDKLRVKFFK